MPADYWLESHQALRDHPKTAKLRRRLGVGLPQAIGHLHLLWWWALTYAEDGDLSRHDPDVIADAACWDDDPGTFVRALIGSGFVDEDLTIHDWDDYAGRLIDRRAENARRMREARQAQRDRLNGSGSGTRAPDAINARAAHVQGLPDLTGPDLTEQNRTPSPQPPPQAEGEGIQTDDAPLGSLRRRSSGGGTRSRQGGEPDVSRATSPPEVAPDDLAPPTEDDLRLWQVAIDTLTAGWLPANVEKAQAFAPLGRGTDGALWVRAPAWARSVASQHQLAACLVNAGDAAGASVVLVRG